jgi:hypothetical protein
MSFNEPVPQGSAAKARSMIGPAIELRAAGEDLHQIPT